MKPTMLSTGGGRLGSLLYVFAVEDGVDTTLCKSAINSESEVARSGGCWDSRRKKTLETFSSHWRCWFVEGLGTVKAGRQAVVVREGLTPGPDVVNSVD